MMPEIIAHRGASYLAPENTLTAFRKAMEIGADGVEMDVQQTGDKKLVIHHDFLIDWHTDMRGQIYDMTMEELKALDFGSWKDVSYKDERIATLQEAHRFQSIAHDGVGGGRKSERCGDDLALQIHGLQRKLQRHVAVGEQLHSRHAHILLQFSLQGFVFFAHVGQPVAVPDGADLFNVFFHAGHGGTGNKDIIVQFCSPFRS